WNHYPFNNHPSYHRDNYCSYGDIVPISFTYNFTKKLYIRLYTKPHCLILAWFAAIIISIIVILISYTSDYSRARPNLTQQSYINSFLVHCSTFYTTDFPYTDFKFN
ncbi:hypothetical protein L9F63_009093, partial [Diploptera punctata]